MEYLVSSGHPEKQRSGCVVLGVYESRRLSPSAQRLDDACEGYLSQALRREDMEGKVGQSLTLIHIPGGQPDRVLLVGCGRERELDGGAYATVVANAASSLSRIHAAEAAWYLAELHVKGRDLAWKVRRAVELMEYSRYRFQEHKSEPAPEAALRRLVVGVPSRRELAAGEQAIKEGLAVAGGVALARDLGNRPSNVCTPTHLADQARALAQGQDRLQVQVLEEAQLAELGMGALLSVTKGSAEPGKLIVMEYRGGGTQKPVALVGKGVTFDTGGISLKPGAEMDEMKFDMCGAASVLGAVRACLGLALPLNVVGVVAAVENMPGGRASKPGDIVETLSGQTVEILNTDAEGRLILCDALSYCRRYEPSAVVDIATLTGACIIALGRHPHGLMSNHDPLARELIAAGETAGDRAWRLPLWEDYQKQLDSNFADMANIGGRDAGAITAACFLSRFTKELHWAHLDIAGTAWKTGKEKGATGRPVPLLVQFLLQRAGRAAT